jgi:predicted ArsR family transcriptional regulator
MHDATTIEVGWWTEIDEQIIACLRNGPQSTQDLAWKLGMSTTAVTSLLSMLAAQGKVHITGAELPR